MDAAISAAAAAGACAAGKPVTDLQFFNKPLSLLESNQVLQWDTSIATTPARHTRIGGWHYGSSTLDLPQCLKQFRPETSGRDQCRS